MTEYVWAIYDGYRDLMDNKSDPRVNDWFLMSGPFPTLAICLFYAYFVKVLGPKLMENRKPFDLRTVMMWYNLAQVIFSSWLFYEAMAAGWWRDYSFRCQPVDYSNNPKALRMARGCWWYYFSKFTEFTDTIFFVLRKKNDHVSTLHVIHHGCMPMSVWFGVKFTPGGHSSFFGLLNTFVHIIMYSYYFLAALGPRIQPYLWWKKYLTTLQMVQFVLVMIHAFQLLFIDCSYPKAFAWWIGMHAIMFYFLFRDFYVSTYKKRNDRKIQAAKEERERKNAKESTIASASMNRKSQQSLLAEGHPNSTSDAETLAQSQLQQNSHSSEHSQAQSSKTEDAETDTVIYANQYKMATGYISDSGLRNRVFIANQSHKQ